MDLIDDLESRAKKMKRDLRFGFKPTDCKHCYVASAGVAGAHYSCSCKESKMYCYYPLIMCPENCQFYEKEETHATTE